MSATHPLLAVIDAYAAATGLPDTTIGSRVFNHSGKVKLLREGRDITVSRMAAALLWFSEHWPENAWWPVTVARPCPRAAESAK